MDYREFRDCIDSSGLSTGVKNSVLNGFKSVFTHAVKYYGLKDTPARHLEPFKKSFKEKMKKKSKELSIWSVEEFDKFISFVPDGKYKAFFMVLFMTGVRLGEILALTWLDFGDHVISINKSVTKFSESGSYEIKDTKNVSSMREISLNDSLYLFLLDYQKREKEDPGYQDSWFMFGRDKPVSRTQITRVKDKAVDLSCVKPITIHQFRHSHASILINGGMNIVAVSRRLGHSDVEMTLKVYTHLFKNKDTEIIDFLEKSSPILLQNLLHTSKDD